MRRDARAGAKSLGAIACLLVAIGGTAPGALADSPRGFQNRPAETSAPVRLAQGRPGGFFTSPSPGAAPAPPPPATVPPSSPAARPPATPAPTVAAPAPAPPALAVAASADGLVARNVRFRIGAATYTAARLEVRGTTMSADELKRVLDAASPGSFRDRAMALSAGEIVIPELRSESTAAGTRHVAIYRDLRIGNVAGGRIATAIIGSGTLEQVTGTARGTGSFARFELDDVDLGLATSLLDPAPAGAAPELRTVYGSFALDGLAWTDPAGASFRIARLAGRDYRARPTADGWTRTLDRLATSPDEAKASSAARNRSLLAAADLFDAFEIGSLEATGFAFADGTPNGPSGRIARIGYSAPSGQPGEFRVDGLEATSPDGTARLASMSLGGFSMKPAIAGMRAVAAAGSDEIGPAEARRLIPVIGTFRMGQIEFGGAAGANAFSIGSMEFAASKPVEGVPTDLQMSLRNIVVPLGTLAAQDPTGQLATLGYKSLDTTFRANIGWNEAGQELVVREVSVDGVDMGAIVVRAVLANVSKDLFSTDQALASVAAVGAAAKSLDIGVENRGLVERILAAQAAEQGKNVDELRRDYGTYAAIGIPALLGSTPAAKTLGQAVGRFIARPGRLTIQLRAKQAPGLGIADFAGAPDPIALLDKVDLTATAE